jgi:hypothetical protein
MGNKLEICYKDKQTYVGQLSKGLYHGTGTLYYEETGDYYQGKFSRGKKSGFGEYYYYYGDKYSGYFFQDRMHGQGKFITSNGYTYFGTFVAGNLMGFGQMYDSLGNLIYSGEFVNGLPHGFGVSFLNNEINYIGRWCINFYEGHGLLIENSCKKYGLFSQGKLITESNIIPNFIQKILKDSKQKIQTIYKSNVFYNKKNTNLNKNLSKILKSNNQVPNTKNFELFNNLHSVSPVNPSSIPKVNVQSETKITVNPFNKVVNNQLTGLAVSSGSRKLPEPKNVFNKVTTR